MVVMGRRPRKANTFIRSLRKTGHEYVMNVVGMVPVEWKVVFVHLLYRSRDPPVVLLAITPAWEEEEDAQGETDDEEGW